MRILLLTVYYLPSQKASAKLIHDLGVELCRQGHEVTILAPAPEIHDPCEVSFEGTLRIVRAKVGRIEDASKAVRAIRESQLSSLIWRRAGRWLTQNPMDLIIFYSPPIFFGALVKRLKALWKCSAYLILRDIFPQWALDAGILHRGVIYRMFRRKEIEQYEASDVIAVQSPGDLKYFARNFSSRSFQMEVLYNWTMLQEAELPKTNYRVELGLQEKVVFFYGGNLGVAQDVDNIVRLAASLVDRPEIYFLLVGFGSEVPRLQQSIRDKGLHNLRIFPPVEQHRYLSMLSEFDIGLITLDRRLSTHNIPGKLLGYMYWGMPILASVNPGNDLFELLNGNQAGVCLANGGDQMLSAAALRLAEDPKLRIEMGRNARSLLERTFSAEAAARQVVRHMSNHSTAHQPALAPCS